MADSSMGMGSVLLSRAVDIRNWMQSVVASPADAAFSLAGVSGLPTIAPVLGVLGLQSYTINSLFIAPLVAETMDVTFTPFNGAPDFREQLVENS